MPFEPDLRASRMETSEGRGIAAARWRRWCESLPDDFRDAFDLWQDHRFDGTPGDPAFPGWMEPKALEAWAKQVREHSELIGFWIAWHQAGGFQGLLLSGWNRATVYRRLKRFRMVFGAHPDEHDFAWITLDLPRAWMDQLLGDDQPPVGQPKSAAKRRK